MKRLREFVFPLVSLALGAAPALAQTGTVTGMVQDGGGQPLAGAQVAVEGTTIGVVSNESGRYLLNNVPVGDHDITVVLLGYASVTQAVTVEAGGTAVRDFVLGLVALSMDEIVVTATDVLIPAERGRPGVDPDPVNVDQWVGRQGGAGNAADPDARAGANRAVRRDDRNPRSAAL
jgi:hypothetical protein